MISAEPVLEYNIKIQLPFLCPNCKGEAEIVDDGDAFHAVCLTCGTQGFRYESTALVKRDFPKHHTLPKIKPIDK